MSATSPMSHDAGAATGYPIAPLPACPPLVERDALVNGLERWVTSPAMRALVAASGWEWPSGSLRELVSELTTWSSAWDFRAGAERHELTNQGDALHRVGLTEELVASVAAALGLAGTGEPVGAFSHVVVLGGMVRACFNRSQEAARLRDRLSIPSVAVLSAHRPIQGAESSDARALGWSGVTLESEAAEAAARDAFAMSSDPSVAAEARWDGDSSSADVAEDEIAEQRRRRSWMVREYAVPGGNVMIVVAPSGDPATRRANTADQLEFWAQRAGIGAEHRVLLVTTAHYVPFQHLEGIRVLGLGHSCGVVTTGTPWNPRGGQRGAAYLQEIRSALRSADRLLAACGPG